MNFRRLFRSNQTTTRRQSKTSDLEKELCRRIKIINELEESMLELWDAQERAIQSKVMECERERLVVKEQLALLERTQKIEKAVGRMLWEQVEICQGQIRTRAEILRLNKREIAIHRKCIRMFAKYTSSVSQREVSQKWRESLRKTRSQSDIIKTAKQNL
ncbi:hypothetical protein ABFA07_010111 [Porites harrisoni]